MHEVVKKVPGDPTLGSELKRIRNDFLHYFDREADEERLKLAIASAADIESGYSIGGETMRADYADEIASQLLYPWGAELTDEETADAVRALHKRTRALTGPVSKFLHQAEASFLAHAGCRVRELPD